MLNHESSPWLRLRRAPRILGERVAAHSPGLRSAWGRRVEDNPLPYAIVLRSRGQLRPATRKGGSRQRRKAAARSVSGRRIARPARSAALPLPAHTRLPCAAKGAHSGVSPDGASLPELPPGARGRTLRRAGFSMTP